MCRGDFLNKHPDEVMDFLNYVSETSKAWDEPSTREAERLKPSSHQKGVMYGLPEDTEMKAKLYILTRRLDELEMKNQHKKQAASELSVYQPSYFNCQSNSHPEEHCLEHAHILNQNNSPINALYSNSYNTDWKIYSNLPWKSRLPAYAPPGAQQQSGSTSGQQQSLPLSSQVEQAILNLSKVVGTFVEEQKVLNVQTSQKIEAVESSLNRKLDNMHSEISKLSHQQLQSSEKGKAPFQAQQYQKVVNEIGLTEDPNARTDEVKAVVTLRSGKELKPAVPELVKSAPLVADPLQEEQSVGKEEVKIRIPPPFPRVLRKKKHSVNQTEMLEVLR